MKKSKPKKTDAKKTAVKKSARPRVLVSDKISDRGVEILRAKCDVTMKTGLSEKEIIEIIPEFDAQIVRAATKVTPRIIKAGKNLKIIGRAGVGVDNIDIVAATQAGILVVNSPEGNIISAAEHTIAMMMSLTRFVPQASCSMKEGKWEKSKFVGSQVYEKTLGVVGFGKIGRLVAERATGLGMKVIVNDPYTNELAVGKIGGRLVDKMALLKEADFITFHVPLSKETQGIFSAEDFRKMKDGVRIINCSRGGVIDENLLLEALNSGKVAGAALDVFTKEPPGEIEILKHPNVITTPHLGASTIEAQANVAIDVAHQIADYFDGLPATGAVNMPPLKPEILKIHKPYLELAEKLGKLLESIHESSVVSIETIFEGDTAGMQTDLITNYLLMGMLKPRFSGSVNVVNSRTLFQNRGVSVAVNNRKEDSVTANIITAVIRTNKSTYTAAAMMTGDGEQRIVNIEGFRINFVPEGRILLITHTDKPGMIGRVGTILGNRNINIAGMMVGREKIRGKAIMALSIDDDVPPPVIAEIKKIPGIRSINLIEF